jgi:hypothetical protein
MFEASGCGFTPTCAREQIENFIVVHIDLARNVKSARRYAESFADPRFVTTTCLAVGWPLRATTISASLLSSIASISLELFAS